MKKAYIFGCSHAAGSEMFDHDLDREYTHSYPALIARDLGYEIQNHAIPGGSNDAVFRILMQMHNSIDEQDLVIFCWMGGSRVEIYCEQNQQWLSFANGQQTFYRTQPHPVALQGSCTGEVVSNHDGWQKYKTDWQKRWLTLDESNEKPQEYRNIIASNFLVQSRSCKAINIHSWAAHYHPWRDTLSSFYWPVGSDEFCVWCHSKKFPHTDWGHFGVEAHRAFADHVLRNMQIESNCQSFTQINT